VAFISPASSFNSSQFLHYSTVQNWLKHKNHKLLITRRTHKEHENRRKLTKGLYTNLQWRRQRSKGARSFRGQKILQPGYPAALFSSKKLMTFFSCRPRNTGRQRRFTVKIKQIKRSDMVTFKFSPHTITKAKQYAGRSQGLSQGGGSSSQII